MTIQSTPTASRLHLHGLFGGGRSRSLKVEDSAALFISLHWVDYCIFTAPPPLLSARLSLGRTAAAFLSALDIIPRYYLRQTQM
mgnify:CR=1 FL=1